MLVYIDKLLQLNSNIVEHQKIIDKNTQKLSDLEKANATLKENIFLFDLDQHPQALLEQLIFHAHEASIKYDRENPANQSLAARICMLELHNKIRYIEQMDAHANEDSARYYLICGLLWIKLDDIELSGKDFSLAETIIAILRHHPINPDEARSLYREFATMNFYLQIPISQEDLSEYEESKYNSANELLEVTLAELKDVNDRNTNTLYCAANTVLASFDHHKKSIQPANEVDIKLHTIILTMINKIVRNKISGKYDPELESQYPLLLKKINTGRPSFYKKLIGSLMMLAGVFEIIALEATNSEDPSKKILGASTALLGLSLFYNGRAKSTFQKMKNLEQALQKPLHMATPVYQTAGFAVEDYPLLPRGP